MVQIENNGPSKKVPLYYYDKYGEKHLVGEADVEIKNGEVSVRGHIQEEVEGDVIVRELMNASNLEAFSISVPTIAATSHVTKTNPNGAVQRCPARHIHAEHEWQAEFGGYFNVYCPGNDGSRE